ncbi:MAG: hypothetical protein B7733_05700 [Myxococcales bacterium FL481]|nr:MAG: hypothetical protein B7733_05700 [Myxococcales bacterium FL481]
MKLTPRQSEALDALSRHDNYADAAAEMGITESRVRGLMCEARQRLQVDSDEEWVVPAVNERYNPETGQWNPTTRRRVFRPRAMTADDITRAVADAKVKPVKARKAPAMRGKDPLILDQVLFGDMHIGMLAHHEEAGMNWDTDISVRVHREAAEYLLSEGMGTHARITTIGDTTHANDQTNATPRSKHQLDCDSRHYRTLRAAIELFEHMTEFALQTHETVELDFVEGNHDPTATIALRLALWARYRNEPRVFVDTSPAEYRIKMWGACGIGTTHSDKATIKRLPLIYCTEYPEFAAAKCKDIWGGHKHSVHTFEDRGVLVELLRTLAPRDAHAAKAGYLAGRSATVVSYHQETGRVNRAWY